MTQARGSHLQAGADPRIIQGEATPGRVLAVLALACLVTAIFMSEPLLSWADSQPDSSATTLMHSAFATWNKAMTTLGATRLYRALHDLRHTIETPGQ